MPAPSPASTPTQDPEEPKELDKHREKPGQGYHNKVVVLVDELDRCRPTYAVELLERVKHLFDVPGVVFVIGVDRRQLTHSVCSLYGAGFDAMGYLRRFLDIDFKLPQAKPGDYCRYLFESLGIRDLIVKRKSQRPGDELRYLEETLGKLFSVSGMTLRDQNHVVARLRLVLQCTPRNHYLYQFTLGVLLFIREWRSDLYESFSSGVLTAEALIIQLEQESKLHPIFAEHEGRLLEATLIGCGLERNESVTRFERYIKLAEAREDGPEAKRAAEVVRIIGSLGNRFEFGGMGFKVSLRRIEMAEPFILGDHA